MGSVTTTPKPFVWRERVRHSETDAQGVVFNAWYLAYCDDALAQFLPAIGLRYEDLVAQAYDMQVVNANISWKSSLCPGEYAEIIVSCSKLGNTSFVLAFDLTCEGRQVATIDLTYVGITTTTGVKRPILADLRERFAAHMSPERPLS